MAFRLGNGSNSARKACTDALVDAVDVGSTNSSGQLKIYTGTQPATPETSATGTLLVTIPFANPAFGAADANASAGLAGGTAISATVAATGTAGWFRVVDRGNVAIMDGTVGTSDTDMIFDNVSFVTGGVATVNSFNVSTPM